jgi:hypothetical protein
LGRAAGFLLCLAAGIPQSTTPQTPPYIRVDDSSVTVAENGGTYTQRVWLPVKPTANVTLQVASGDTSVLTVNPTTLTFTPSNHSIKQEVTYTAVDDSALNHPPQHRRTTVTYTASGGNYAGVTYQVAVTAADDEPVGYIVDEGLSYQLRTALVVRQGCTPVVLSAISSDPSVLSVDPEMVSWTEQDSGTTKTMTITFHDNDSMEEGRVTLRRSRTEPCGDGIPIQDLVFTVRNNDTWSLSVEGSPACGATLTDDSMEATSALVLTPAPSAEMETEYRWVTDAAQGEWAGNMPVSTSGRSATVHHARLSDLRAAYAGFEGFHFRLKDEPEVTAQCTWQFDDHRNGADPEPEPTRLLSISYAVFCLKKKTLSSSQRHT